MFGLTTSNIIMIVMSMSCVINHLCGNDLRKGTVRIYTYIMSMSNIF